jgi:hypothetical protein
VLDAGTLAYWVVATSTKSKASVNTMTSGSKYWFRVVAVGEATGPAKLIVTVLSSGAQLWDRASPRNYHEVNGNISCLHRRKDALAQA